MRFTLLLLLLACGATMTLAAVPRRAAAYLCWSPTALYVAFNIDEPHVTGDQTEPLSQPWLDDAVALYLDFTPDDPAGAGVQRVVVSAAGGMTVQRLEHGEWRDQTQWFDLSQPRTIRCGTRVLGTLNKDTDTDRGYQVELGLAWELLGVAPPVRLDPNAPLPCLRMALAVYPHGDADRIACWPTALDGISVKSRGGWGTAVFLQSMKPRPAGAGEIIVPLAAADPTVDGILDGLEWLTSGVVVFPLPVETATVLAPPQVPIVAAWYSLSPPATPPMYPPLHRADPWAAPESPAYHQQELREMRAAGLDALGVVLPVNPSLRAPTQARLRALCTALAELRDAAPGRVQATPLLFPVLQLSGEVKLPNAEVSSLLHDLLTDFYDSVPPQDRLLLPDDGGVPHAPVLVDGAAPLPLVADVQPHAGHPIGWLLDGANPLNVPAPDVLAICRWDALTGMHLGTGPLSVACIAPGVVARKDYLPYRGGAVYDNGWLKVRAAHPALVLVRSWNDFAGGTAIAPTRAFGHAFIDATRLAALHTASDDIGGVRLLGANVPSVLTPGAVYPVELTLKNALPRDLTTSEGYRVSYRLVNDRRVVVSGHAPLLLLGLTTGRVAFTLPTGDPRPLPAGKYMLEVDVEHQATPLMELPFLTKTLTTLRLPVLVGVGAAPDVLTAEVPGTVGARLPAPVRFTLRNPGPHPWTPEGTALTLQWQAPSGKSDDLTRALTLDAPVPVGGAAVFAGRAPAAPREPGTWCLVGMLTGTSVPVLCRQVEITAEPPAAYTVVAVDLPGALDGAADATVTVRNAGNGMWDVGTVHVAWQWLTWDGNPVRDAQGDAPVKDAVAPGRAITLAVPVTPPPGVGPFRCVFGMTGPNGALTLRDDPLAPSAAGVPVLVRTARMLPVDLTAAYNDSAAATETAAHRADVDGRGNAFPAELFLPDADTPECGYPAGYGVPDAPPSPAVFLFGWWKDGLAPLARAKGQRIPLPARPAVALHLAACATAMHTGALVTVRYTDGSEARTALDISSWIGSAENDEPVLFTTRYLRAAKGDNRLLSGSVYAYRVPLDPGKTPDALVLPDEAKLCLFAVTLEAKP